MTLRLDTLPSQPKETPERQTDGSGGLRLETLPSQPDTDYISALPDDTPIFETSFEQRMDDWTRRMMVDVYGQDGLDKMAKDYKRLEFFISRAPRIALLFAAPLYAVAYEVLDQGIGVLVSKAKDEKYDPLQRRMLTELLPEETPMPLKVTADIGEMLGRIALIGGAMNLAKQGLLKETLKEVGVKLEKAGYGTNKMVLTEKSIKTAAKGTRLEDAAKAYIKSKNISARMHYSRQIGSVKTPMGKDVDIVRPDMAEPLAMDAGIAFRDRVGILKDMVNQGLITEKKLGDLMIKMPPGQVEPSTPADMSEMQRIVHEYDYEDLTLDEVVQQAEGIDDPEIEQAVESYKVAVHDARFEFGERSHMPNLYGEKVLELLRGKMSTETPEEAPETTDKLAEQAVRDGVSREEFVKGKDYGLREDGTKKGMGFLGELKTPQGEVVTELSIGVNIDGKETEIPSIVPTLTKTELQHLLSGGEMTRPIVQKAVDHAKVRLSEGKSPFADESDLTQAYDKAQGADKLAEPTVVEPLATTSQKKVAHTQAKKKGLLDSKGRVKEEYRSLAEKTTGKRSMTEMSEKEAEAFIDAIRRIPDIRRTFKDFPSEKRFKTRPGLTTHATPQNITSEILGLKPFVEPMERAQMTLMKETSVLRKEVHDVLGVLDKETNVSREDMALALNKYENATDLPTDKFDEKSIAVFDYFRTLTRSMLDRMNEIREEYGFDPIVGIEAYYRHIVDPLAQEIMYGNDKLPEALKKWASENLSDKVYNPMEKKRKIEDKLLEYFSKDIEYVMNAMVRTALKEIHMTGPKQMLNDLKSAHKKPTKKDLEKMSPEERVVAEQIEEMPVETEKWLNDYVKIVLLREEQTTLDQRANAWLKEDGVGKFVKDQFLKHGVVLSDQAFTNLISEISKLPLYGTLALRPKPIIRNKFQRLQDIALYGVQAVWRGALPTSNYPLLEELKADSLFRDVYSGIEGMDADLKRQIGGVLLKGFQWSAFSNVDQTMNAAFHWAMDKIQDPAKRDLGWADPQRDYTEDKDFLYPSERGLVLKEMEFGGQTTQYLYFGPGMPQLFRHKIGTPITRLQSWWMNHWFNFLREATHRSLTGEVGWEAYTISKGTGPLGKDEIISRRPKVDAKSRTNLLWYLLIGGTVLNTLGYGRSFLLGTMPLQPPPAAAFAIHLVTYLASSDENVKRKAAQGMKDSAMTFLPGYLGYKDASAFLRGDTPLSSYLLYNNPIARRVFRPR